MIEQIINNKIYQKMVACVVCRRTTEEDEKL